MKTETIVTFAALAALAFLLYNYHKKKGLSSMSSNIPANEMSTHDNATMEDPSKLLPADTNNKWGYMNPTGTGQLQGITLMKAGSQIGINTVGSSLRNANLQVRSEPPNPQLNVGPWNHSTIDPDNMRTPLELHCGPP